MKITAIEPIIVGNPWKNWVFIQIETDEGLVGLGEATVGLNTLPVDAAVREIRHLCIGADPRDVHALWDRLYKSMYLAEGQVQHAAMAGIEMACWDILGKSLGVPVYRLLGGVVRDGLRAYANGWYKGPRDPVFVAERAQEVVALGYTALKFDPFGRAFMTMSPAEERLSLTIARAVREAVGDDVDLIVEAHDRFNVTTAIRLGRQLEEVRPLWFETPVLSSDVADLVAVAKAIPIPVGTGERFTRQREFAELLQHEVIDIITPETIDVGGLWAAREVASLANMHNAVIALHNARGPVCTTVNCQLSLTMPNFLIQEMFADFNEPWTHDLVRGVPRVVDGYIQVGDAPGLGVELDMEIARAHPYHASNFMRFFEDGWEARFGARQRE